ncbi:MAG: nucleotidyltransferase domain-containing protein [Nocardioidaceae bacterium]
MQSSSESAGLPEVDPAALHIVESFVADVESRLPGLLAEVYPTGSALTDDRQPANSDVDVVFVVRRPVTAADGAELTQAHAATQSVHTTGSTTSTGVPHGGGARWGPDQVTTAPQVTTAASPGLAARPAVRVTWRS